MPRDIATLSYNASTGIWTLIRRGNDTVTFTTSGLLASHTDANGHGISLSYTGTQLSSISDAANRTLAVGWTSGHITSVTDANVNPARQVTFQYNNGAGDLTDVIDVNGGHTHYAYDASHHLTNEYDPNCYAAGTACNQGNGVVTHYNGAGQVDWQQDQLGRTTSFSYSGNPTSATGSTTAITDPKGNKTLDQYQYGMLTAKTKGYTTASAATWSYTYDPTTATLATSTDPNGHTTRYFRDSQGNQVGTTDALGRSTSATYNTLDEPVTEKDGNSVTTTYTYDGNGNLTSVSRPLLSSSGGVLSTRVTNYCYYGNSTCGAPAGAAGDVYKMTDPDGNSWQYSYDAYGDRTAATDPLQHTTTTCYNADGWRLASYTPKAGTIACAVPPPASAYETTYSYIQPNGQTDQFGDVQTVTDPLGHFMTTTYDANRNVVTSKDANGNPTQYGYDLANERTDVTRADLSKLHTDYNADGTVLDQQDGKTTKIQTYGYDPIARVTSVTDALGNVTAYTYDGAGNRVTQQAPGGNCVASPPSGCTTMTYDAANQLTKVTYSDGVTPNISSISYDADGQRTGMSDGTGNSVWAWDSLHRLTSFTDGHGDQVQYQYNLRGLVTQVTYPGGRTVTRGYDNAGRWTSVQDWLAGSTQTTFGYDADNNLKTETLPSSTGVVDTTGYNAADQLTSISDVKGSSTLFGATYGRDNAGQVASDSSLPSAVAADRYTNLNQLCYAGSATTNGCASPPAGAQAYSFDAADNLTGDMGTTQAFNAADELCWTIGGASSNGCATAPTYATTYAYDTRGNRTAAIPPAVPVSYAYDQANRLVGVHATSSLVAVTGTDNALWVKQDGGSLTSLGGALSAAPAVVFVPVGNGQPPVPVYLGVASDHRVWVRMPALGWQLLSSTAQCLDNVAAAVSGPVGGTTLTVACQGTDHALYYAQTSVAPTSLPSIGSWTGLGGILTAGPAVASVGGTITFFVTGLGGALFSRTVTTGYVPIVGAMCSGHPAAAMLGSTAYLACQGGDHALWYSVNTGSGWGAFQSAGGQIQDGPGIAATASSVTMFVTGTNGVLYHTTIPPGGGTATPFVSDGGALLYGTGAAGYDASAAYAYNGDGLRMQKTLSSSAPSAYYTWDVSGSLPLLLQDGTNTYVYGPNGLPVEQVSTSGSVVTYLHHDQLGSTRALTDATGAVVGTYTFDAYGNTVLHSGSTTTPLVYAGQYQDAESGLYYLRARYYDPTSAQFLSRDPVTATTRSPYGYVYGNPLNRTDPSGECGLWGNDTCLGDAAGWVNNNVIHPASNWVEHNFGTVATVAAAGVCVAASLGVCAGAVAIAFVARSSQRWIYEGGSQSLGADALDAGTTLASFGLVGIPSAIGTGGAPEWMTAALGIGPQAEQESQAAFTLWQSLLAKGLLAAPDAIDLSLDLMQSAGHSCP